ncbi:hypothetical protein [Flavobacterium sp.]|jgi:hypothetical protein|uniref:hypothetical protein n=1 Tax=Flavobacterium sp. TaxID=239 RepID=UPI0037C0F591
MNKQFNYPILHLFENDKNIYAQKQGPQIASVSKLCFFDNSIILDVNGYCYLVKKANKVGWLNFFGFHPLIKGRTAKIDYEFYKIEKISVEEFKGVDENFWYSKKQIPNLIKQVQDCKDFIKIIKIFI